MQERLLADLGITDVEAMFVFNLAPLRIRRQIAMLGVIHRSVLGLGPAQLQVFFKRTCAQSGHLTRAADKRHGMQLVDPGMVRS